jgi:hypothetical protein
MLVPAGDFAEQSQSLIRQPYYIQLSEIPAEEPLARMPQARIGNLRNEANPEGDCRKAMCFRDRV